ncbi:GNAT family N-acetyltransferase [Paenibacillus sp. GCM10027626]|uniref:GNAT family N-acetyltransferase n=1 Tax=Paenibacillus sp. GCM10027626 TaxID=3273411 RepID=UPI003627930A
MEIILATKNELQWVNEQYQKIGFMPSNLENETIAIVTYKDKYAGVGRIVYLNEEEVEIGGIYILDEFRGLSLANGLVDYLVREARKSNLKEVYCLPFEELKHFYGKFGFEEVDYEDKQINIDILKKLRWCLDNYEKKVLLLKL